MKKFRDVLGILFYLVAGLFLFAANYAAFDQHDSLLIAFIIIGILLLLAAFLFLIGFWFRQFINWRLALGVVIIFSSAFAVLSILSMFYFSYSIEQSQSLTLAEKARMATFLPNPSLNFNYMLGVIYTLIMIALAIFFIKRNKMFRS